MARRTQKPLTWTKRIDRMLNNPRSRTKRRFDIFIAILVLVSTAIIFVGGFDHGEIHELPPWLDFIDHVILGIFLIEYIARVVFTRPDLPTVVKLSKWQVFRYHVEARIKWMLTPMAIIDLMAVLPLFALDRSLGNFKLFRVIRVLRLLRLYRLVMVYNPLEKLGKAFRRNSLLYIVASSMLAILVVMGSISFYIVEGNSHSGIEGPFDAVYWAIVTLTTVGYGDISPETPQGKLVALGLMISGMILVAVFAGVMSQTMVGYLLDVREERVRMSSTVNHFIICGWNSRGPMVAEELQHLAPDEEIIVFADIDEPQDLPEDATFLRGNPTKESEWDKVRLSMATNILVLAPPSGGNNSASDGHTALVVYTVRSYESKLGEQGVERSVPLHISAELLDPENYKHINVAGADEVVHTAQVGSNLIAHSSVKPGMGRVVTELISWWGQGIDLEDVPEWLTEDTPFKDVAARMREESRYLVVGVVNEDGKITLNPKDKRVVKAGFRLVVIRNHEDDTE